MAEPSVVVYEPATGVPAEYVEFLEKPDVLAALPYILANHDAAWINTHMRNQTKLLGVSVEDADSDANLLMEKLKEMSLGGGGSSAGGASSGAEGSGAAAGEAGGEQKEKKKSGGGKKVKHAPHVTLTLTSRQKRKAITNVTGLEAFDVKLNEAAKLFGKKFACGSSVVKDAGNQKDEIDVQGDNIEGLRDLILKTWKNISADDITLVDKRK